MGWSTIRKATSEDTERLNAAAQRFVERHELGDDVKVVPDESSPLWYELSEYLEVMGTDWPNWDIPKLRRLWRQCVRRALREPNAEGIAYGYVGQHVNTN